MQVHVAFSADDHYLQHLTVTIYSLLQVAGAGHFYHLHILDGGISDINKKKLIASLKNFTNKSLKFYQIDKNIFKDTQKFLHLNEVCYFRILLPNILKNIKKVLYLDADLLIFDDVAKIFATSLSANNPIAAVKVFHPNYQQVLSKQFKTNLSFCFNTGVLLINLQAMRRNNLVKKLITFSIENTNKLLAADQDVFNIVMNNKVSKLDPTWNVGSYIFYAKSNFYCQLSQKKFQQLKNNPGIIHFDGAKPWSFAHFHPYRKQYFTILDQTEFSNWRPKFNLRSLIANSSFYLATQLMNLLPDMIYKIAEFHYLKNNFLERRYRESNL